MIVDIVYGFLGAGKTIFIRNILENAGMDERIVVLVNEFGEVGIDGDLLAGQGGDVVEMPSGCICCTLQSDFRAQMLDITKRLTPDRLIIEPTGVATVQQINAIAGAQLFEAVVRQIRHIMIADALGFMPLYKANRHFVESQVKNAHLVLLNKCDQAAPKKAGVIQSALSAINPEISILTTSFGMVDWDEYRAALASVPPNRPSPFAAPHVHNGEDGMGYESLGFVYDTQSFAFQALDGFFRGLAVQGSDLGRIVRAKGIFQVEGRQVLMELASGAVSSQPIRQEGPSKLSVIGTRLSRERIQNRLRQCMSG